MENTFKSLWSEKNEMFVHFDFSPLTDDVIWGYSELPQLMTKDSNMELLQNYLGKHIIFPEGTVMKTIEIKFIEENETSNVSEDRTS